jgi:hypothetical protein
VLCDQICGSVDDSYETVGRTQIDLVVIGVPANLATGTTRVCYGRHKCVGRPVKDIDSGWTGRRAAAARAHVQQVHDWV